MKTDPAALCLANIRAWLRWTGLDCQVDPVRIYPDRVFWPRDARLEQHVRQLAGRGVLLSAPSGYKGPDVIEGWREDVGRCSAQVILRETEIEIDFDHWNPTRDVAGAVGHGVEVVINKFGKRKTNPEKIAADLKKRGIHA